MEFNQLTNKEVLKSYNHLDNFEIVIEPKININRPSVCINFSSNGVYFPNTLESFNEFISKDRYEWNSNKLDSVEKHIFIRDVFKQWYANGINAEINSIDKLIEFLRKETKGYDIITIGSSSGGYMAMLLGRVLCAKKIFSFNGQFNIWDRITIKENIPLNPLLNTKQNDESVSKYFNIVPSLNIGESPIFYFNSIFSDWDKEQSNYTHGLQGFYPFFIKSDVHGIPFYKQNLSKVLSLKSNKLKKLSSMNHMSQFMFSLKLDGFLNTLKYYKRNNI